MHKIFTTTLVKSSSSITGRRKKKWIPECTDPLCETVENSKGWDSCRVQVSARTVGHELQDELLVQEPDLSTTMYWRADRPWQLSAGLPSHTFC